jgi:hypothetical protein
MPNGIYIPSPVSPTDSRANREAFLSALQEIDYETYQRLDALIYKVASLLVRECGLLPETALGQAVEFVAACVWNRATAPERQA